MVPTLCPGACNLAKTIASSEGTPCFKFCRAGCSAIFILGLLVKNSLFPCKEIVYIAYIHLT